MTADDFLLGEPTPLDHAEAARRAHERICQNTATAAEILELVELRRQTDEAWG